MALALSKEVLFIENTPPPATLTKRCAKAKEISSNYVSALTKSCRSTLEVIMARGASQASDLSADSYSDTIKSAEDLKVSNQSKISPIRAEDSGHWVEVQVPKSTDGKIVPGQGVRYMMYEIMPVDEAAS